MITVELTIRNGDDRRTLTATAPTYDAAKADVDGQVAEGWTRLHYFQR